MLRGLKEEIKYFFTFASEICLHMCVCYMKDGTLINKLKTDSSRNSSNDYLQIDMSWSLSSVKKGWD